MQESHKKDIDSDPAKDDQLGSDWVSEGGSTPTGPATDTRADGTTNGEDTSEDTEETTEEDA